MKLEISVVQFVINNSPKEFLVLIINKKNEIMSYNEKQIYHHAWFGKNELFNIYTVTHHIESTVLSSFLGIPGISGLGVGFVPWYT